MRSLFSSHLGSHEASCSCSSPFFVVFFDSSEPGESQSNMETGQIAGNSEFISVAREWLSTLCSWAVWNEGIAYWVGWGPRAHLDSGAQPTPPPAAQVQPQPAVFLAPPHLPQMQHPAQPQQVIQFQVQPDQVLVPVGDLLLLVQNPIVL